MERITLNNLKGDSEIEAYIEAGNIHLGSLGFTDHGQRHAGLVAAIAGNIMDRLGFTCRERELAEIAGYLHDIGNLVSRHWHAQVGAALAERLLWSRGMSPQEIATVIGAIGTHDPEDAATSVNPVSAALILADKSDVHRSRVRNQDKLTFDQHDRVNYAVTKSFLKVEPDSRILTLQLEVDTDISPVMEYFEIFLTRMLACKKAAEFLNARFELEINHVRLL